MTFKCKICGGQTTVDSVGGIMICEYCGTKQTLPLFTDDSERLLYESGNNYLSHNEYDKAENVFNQLLTIKPDAAELYWALVLCKYGVAYVKDHKTQKYIPTCNRTHYSPVFSDKNYQRAIELSSGEKKALFEDDAKTIDNIQKGIIAISKKEKPFDVFISYKETDTNGNRTKDSVEAQKLYEKLTEAGYKVFFSRITLEDKIGTEYEPYIYAALYSSKVMITVSSSKENIDAVWVKNEWSRFLSLRQNDSSKTLLPLYFDMAKADLPEEFALLSSYNMSDNGLEDELIRGIKKLIPIPTTKIQRQKELSRILLTASVCMCVALIVLGTIFIPDYFKNKKYQNAKILFGNAQYEEAAKEFDLLGKYKDSKEMLEKCDFQPDYDKAEKLYYDGYYAESSWAFEQLGNYEDSLEKKEQAQLSWRKKLATVIEPQYAFADYSGRLYVSGIYYITPNGTIDSSTTKGNAHKDIKIIEHGPVISIATIPGHYSFIADKTYNSICALHSDGYVTGIKTTSNTEWNNIVKIAPGLGNSNIALSAEGTMLYSSTTDEWLAPLTDWTNIIDFEVEENHKVIIGIKSNGTLCVISNNASLKFNIEKIISDFSNITELKFNFTDTNNTTEASINTLNIAALTKDGKLLTYSDGVFKTHTTENVCRIISPDYILKTNGNLISIEDERKYLGNIAYGGVFSAYPDKGFAITKSGKYYDILSYDKVKDSGNRSPDENLSKTIIYEEWLSRMD